MFRWLKRKRHDGDEAPAASVGPPGPWVFDTPARSATFHACVQAYFTQRGLPHEMREGLVLAQSGGDDHRFGLENLALQCTQLSESDWPALIERHFDSFYSGLNEMEFDSLAGEWATLGPRVVPRLWRTQDLDTIGGEHRDASAGDAPSLMRWPTPLPGIEAVLQVDLADASRTLLPETLDALGVTHDDALAAAVGNLDVLDPVTPEQLAGPDGVELWLLMGESIYAASHLLRLARWPELIGGHGSLVAVPARNTLLVAPVRGVSVVQAVQPILELTLKVARGGAGALSESLYWLRPEHDDAIELPYAIEDRTLQFTPPESFVALLNRLAEDDA